MIVDRWQAQPHAAPAKLGLRIEVAGCAKECHDLGSSLILAQANLAAILS
jgi:hypothetical protein